MEGCADCGKSGVWLDAFPKFGLVQRLLCEPCWYKARRKLSGEVVIWSSAGGGGEVRAIHVPAIEGVRFEIEDGNAGPGPMCGKGCPGERESFDFTTDESDAMGLSRAIAKATGNEPATFWEDVRDFHRRCGLVVGERAGLLPTSGHKAADVAVLAGLLANNTRAWAAEAGNEDAFLRRARLIAEEFAELVDAHQAGDVAEFADALADLAWVVLGTAVEAGIPFNAVWEEVARANLAKAGGKLDASGKLQKPPGWKAPDIAGVLAGVASSTRRPSSLRAQGDAGSSGPGVDDASGAEHFRRRFERVG